MKRRRLHVISLMAVCSLIAGLFFMAPPAMADSVGGAGTFSCSGGKASGTLYESNSSCPTKMSPKTIFSFLVCNMEQLSSNVLGNMFCGMMQALIPGVMAMLTLAVLIFGIGFTIGVIPATASEFQAFLLKITFIFIFATQADYLIGYGYRFLVDGMRDAVTLLLASYFPPTNPDGSPAAAGTVTSTLTLYTYLDGFLGQVIAYATDYVGQPSPDDRCKNALFAVLAVMFVAFPPLTYVALLLIARIAMTFVRAVFGYIYALTGIAFLLTLAPFFLSFYLFRVTRQLFEKWIGYLVSFSLQIVILFAFLVFILSINVSTITSSFADIIVPVAEQPTGTAISMPWQYCTVCQFKAVYKDGGGDIPDSDTKGFISNGKLQCTDPKTPIKLTSATAPEGGAAPSKAIINSLLKFTFAGLASLLVLAYIVEGLLMYLPSLAQVLAGSLNAYYAPQLGGGFSPHGIATPSLPGEGLITDFTDGFNRGFRTSNNSIGGVLGGMRAGISNMLTGRDEGDGPSVAASDTNDESQNALPGLHNRFLSWLSNPQDSHHQR